MGLCYHFASTFLRDYDNKYNNYITPAYGVPPPAGFNRVKIQNKMTNISKSLNLYKSRCVDLEGQLQVVDASLDFMYQHVKSTKASNKVIGNILKLSLKQYPLLNCRSQNAIQLINRTKKNNYEFCLRRIYTHFGEYSKNLLREIYDVNPLLVVGKAPNSLQFHEIVKLGDFNNIADYMVEEVFKRLEGERSTSKTIQKLIAGTNIVVPKDILEEALFFFEVRHLIVHQSGRIDQAFFNKYGKTPGCPSNSGGRLNLNLGFARKAIKAISSLLESIDSQILIIGHEVNS